MDHHVLSIQNDTIENLYNINYNHQHSFSHLNSINNTTSINLAKKYLKEMNYRSDLVDKVIEENPSVFTNNLSFDVKISILINKLEDEIANLPSILPEKKLGTSSIFEKFGNFSQIIMNKENDLEEKKDLIKESFYRPLVYKENIDIRINENVESCVICLESIADKGEKIVKECGHKVCGECLRMYLEQKIVESDVQEIKCPIGQGCLTILEPDFITENISENLKEKYNKFKIARNVDNDPNLRWCIRPGCEKYMPVDRKTTQLVCECGTEMCSNCLNPWHQGVTCEKALELEIENYIISKKIQLCPKCRSKIEKSGGCNHMSCTRCKYEFCWICLRHYTKNHYRSWNLLGCPGLMYSTSFDYGRCGNCLLLIIYNFLLAICFILSIPLTLVLAIFIAMFAAPAFPCAVMKKKIDKHFCGLCVLGLVLWPVWFVILIFPIAGFLYYYLLHS